MERLVVKSLKADLHIHSIFSKYKDKLELIKDGTEENLNQLVEKLNKYEVNIAAITDHDYFSYSLYKKFQTFEGYGTLVKVLPGVEFSVGIKNDKNEIKCIHIITIFDDSSEEKLKKIGEVLSVSNDKINYNNDDKMYFSEERFISILNEIGLNVILIAHQKNSVTSKKNNDNDLMSLGEVTFNEFLKSEVFDALEFKSMKSGLFNNLYALEKNKEYDIVKFITGSDCHTWDSYPKHDNLSAEDDDFQHTFLKCLPTFKGLCMALTDYSRISLSKTLFSNDDKKLEKIQLNVNGTEYEIPMSKGINAIIGDNSIGKSLLIHKLTKYNYLDEDKIKSGYEDYLSDKKIIINTVIDKDNIYHFDGQGDIRKRFETKDESKNQTFLQERYPIPPVKDNYIEIINQQFNKLYNILKNKFKYDEEIKKLKTLLMIDKDIKTKNISVKSLTFNKNKYDGFMKLKTYFEGIISKISDPALQVNNGLTQSDVLEIMELKKKVSDMKDKYMKLEKLEKRIYDIKTGIKAGISKFNLELKNYKDSIENIKDSFESDIDEVSNIISNLIILKRNIKMFKFDLLEEIEVNSNMLRYGEYQFVKRFKNVTKITNNYLDSILKRTLKSNFIIDTERITESELNEMIKNDKKLPNVKPVEVLRAKVEQIINSDFEVESVILKANQDVSENLSNGLNSTLYFDIIADDKTSGIYFIDQPEDDVSQTAIKTNLIKDFKKMSSNRQIVLITHNPQFVVNLDVDNVICICKKNDEINIDFGSLEYEDEETNIIESVANNLDGGVDSIRKRWKRYGKEINF